MTIQSRRSFLKLGVATAFLATSGIYLKRFNPFKLKSGTDVGPIDRSEKIFPSKTFSGDNYTRGHGALWDKENYLKGKGGIPPVTDHHSLVVVGGGMSGLLSAYLLRDLKPLILEQAPRFGGNSKGESWEGIDYSIGAAYFIKPNEGSEWEKLLHELEIDKHWRVVDEDDPVLVKKNVVSKFWTGTTDEKEKKQFTDFETLMKNVWDSKNGEAYPEIPMSTEAERKITLELDKLSFFDWLSKKHPNGLHPHIASCVEHYCWSTFGSSSREISAAAGLNNFSAEFGETVVVPGGNSFVAETVFNKLNDSIGPDKLKASSLVVDAYVEGDKTHIVYEASDGKLIHITSDALVMACPKFIAKKVIRDLEPKRLEAIQQLKYRAYLVANVLLDAHITDEFYDMFILSEEKDESRNPNRFSEIQNVTDIVLADYAMNKSLKKSVLTLYRALPFDGGRPMVYQDSSHQLFQDSFRSQIETQILPALKVDPKSIKDIRMTRWGHPMVVPQKGLLMSGVCDEIVKPFKDRIFFVEQDNWALPAIETSSAEAMYWAPKIRSVLKS